MLGINKSIRADKEIFGIDYAKPTSNFDHFQQLRAHAIKKYSLCVISHFSTFSLN